MLAVGSAQSSPAELAHSSSAHVAGPAASGTPATQDATTAAAGTPAPLDSAATAAVAASPLPLAMAATTPGGSAACGGVSQLLDASSLSSVELVDDEGRPVDLDAVCGSDPETGQPLTFRQLLARQGAQLLEGQQQA
jgi:hypothetical protein